MHLRPTGASVGNLYQKASENIIKRSSMPQTDTDLLQYLSSNLYFLRVPAHMAEAPAHYLATLENYFVRLSRAEHRQLAVATLMDFMECSPQGRAESADKLAKHNRVKHQFTKMYGMICCRVLELACCLYALVFTRKMGYTQGNSLNVDWPRRIEHALQKLRVQFQIQNCLNAAEGTQDSLMFDDLLQAVVEGIINMNITLGAYCVIKVAFERENSNVPDKIIDFFTLRYEQSRLKGKPSVRTSLAKQQPIPDLHSKPVTQSTFCSSLSSSELLDRQTCPLQPVPKHKLIAKPRTIYHRRSNLYTMPKKSMFSSTSHSKCSEYSDRSTQWSRSNSRQLKHSFEMNQDFDDRVLVRGTPIVSQMVVDQQAICTLLDFSD